MHIKWNHIDIIVYTIPLVDMRENTGAAIDSVCISVYCPSAFVIIHVRKIVHLCCFFLNIELLQLMESEGQIERINGR